MVAKKCIVTLSSGDIRDSVGGWGPYHPTILFGGPVEVVEVSREIPDALTLHLSPPDTELCVTVELERE